MAKEKTSKSKTKIDDEAKKAMDLVQHLELDLQKVKEHLKNISTGASKDEVSHAGTSKGASNELSHEGGEFSHTGVG
jgi:hypothetical protein